MAKKRRGRPRKDQALKEDQTSKLADESETQDEVFYSEMGGMGGRQAEKEEDRKAL